jgi:hypothetical protein
MEKFILYAHLNNDWLSSARSVLRIGIRYNRLVSGKQGNSPGSCSQASIAMQWLDEESGCLLGWVSSNCWLLVTEPLPAAGGSLLLKQQRLAGIRREECQHLAE